MSGPRPVFTDLNSFSKKISLPTAEIRDQAVVSRECGRACDLSC